MLAGRLLLKDDAFDRTLKETSADSSKEPCSTGSPKQLNRSWFLPEAGAKIVATLWSGTRAVWRRANDVPNPALREVIVDIFVESKRSLLS